MPPPSHDEPDRHELIEEAFILLTYIDSLLSGVYWFHIVEEYTEEELTRRYKNKDGAPVDLRTIRRWLNGYIRSDRQYIWGARDYIECLFGLLLEAARCHGRSAVHTAIRFATQTNPSGTPFPHTLLDIFQRALVMGAFPRLLVYLTVAQRNNTYGRAMSDLLEHYVQGHLDRFLEELRPEPERDRGEGSP